MGKTNKAHRTKGNTRPSNSGHSAQLLSFNGKALSGFIGFDALEKETPSYIPVTGQHASDTADCSVDSDFRMVMRKMLKRDCITRLKAVQEFGDHCNEKSAEIVKNVLPFWPRLFNKLALDIDRRIREATHQANRKLILKVKREIAPYLKNIMGVWLLGQCDLYAPAASAAQASFESTFPPAKQSEALMYCKSEIFLYFKDNLFEQTAKSMSEPNPMAEEDVENKYILVISATLQAMKLVLTTVSSSDLTNIQDDYIQVVSENKFWKYAKNKETQIRASWYALVSSLCQIQHNVFNNLGKKLATAVLGCLSESNSLVAPAIWEAALHIIVNIENCWQGIDIHKVVLPQLWTLLKEGGRGNAHILFPCLLPFLSKFPRDIVEKQTFQLQFFSCLIESLSLENVKVSPMECDSILEAFMECLQFMCFNLSENLVSGSTLLLKVLNNQIVLLVESSLYEIKMTHLTTSKLYPLLGVLLRKTEEKCCMTDEKISKAFDKVLTLFWENMFVVTSKVFDKGNNKKSSLCMCLTNFFHGVFSSRTKIEKGKVRFQDDNNDVSDSSTKQKLNEFDSSPVVTLSCEMPHSFEYVVKFAKTVCKKINESYDLFYLKILNEIFGSALNKELFKEFLNSYSNSYKAIPEAPLIFFKEEILKWVVAVNDDCDSISYIVGVIFSIWLCVSKNEALEMLNYCCEVKIPVFLEKMFVKALEIHQKLDAVNEWLRSSSFLQAVFDGLQDSLNSHVKCSSIVSKNFTSLLTVLNLYLEKDELHANLVETRIIEKILLMCKDCLQQRMVAKDIELERLVIPTCVITKSIVLNCKICWDYIAVDDYLSLLYQLNLNSVMYGLSDTSSKAVLDVWHSAVISSVQNRNKCTNKDNFILRAACELHDLLLSLTDHQKALLSLEHSLSLLHSVEEALSFESIAYSSTFVLSELMEKILPSEKEWEMLKEGLNISVLPSFFEREIFYPLLCEDKFTSPEANSVQKLVLASEVISGIFTAQIDSFSSDENESFFQEYIIQHVPHLLWSLTYCKRNGCNIEEKKNYNLGKMLENSTKIISFLSSLKVEEILKDIFNFSLCQGLYWLLPFQTALEIIENIYPETVAEFSKMIAVANESESKHKSLVAQILIPYISFEQKVLLLKNLLQKFCEVHDNMPDQMDKLYSSTTAEICCLLQYKEVLQFVEVQSLLKSTVWKIINYNYQEEKFLHYLQMGTALSSFVNHVPSIINQHIWDYFVCLLSCCLKEGKAVKFSEPKDLLLLHLISSVFCALSLFNQRYDKEEYNSKCESMNNWKPVISNEICEDFIFMFIHIADISSAFMPLSPSFESIMTHLCEAITFIPGECLMKSIIEPSPTNSEILGQLEKGSIDSALDSFILTLVSDIRQLQFASHSLIIKAMPLLSSMLSNIPRNDDDDNDDEEKIPTKLSPLIELLRFTNDVVESMLLDIRIGDCCTVVPYTDSYIFATAYLLAWLEILEYISASPSQVRSGYVAHLEETKLLSSLFSNVFRLMPENPLICLKKDSRVETPKKENLILLFLHPPKMVPGFPSFEEIQAIACYVFATALRRVPASVRTWWNNLDSRSADIVNGFTTKYISGILCAEEIQAVHDNEMQFVNMTVRARPGSREVIATYTIDDSAIELCVQLPTNYPLGPISAEKRGKIAIAQQEWRHWLMQLTTVLTYQNGSILDGLNIWKKNLDKKFEGVEECMICYYILHSSSLKLPKLSCHVCRKKFHSACLYKWFHSSNNFTCPLCRNEFAI